MIADYVGRRFHRLIVLAEDFDRRRHLKCRCDCGTEKSVRVDHLVAKKVVSCGCHGRQAAAAALFTGYKDLSGEYWTAVKVGARDRNIPMRLTIEQAHGLLGAQGYLCPYTGKRLCFGPCRKGRGQHNCSLDRIDSRLPYSPDNCEWVWKPINQMKWKLEKSRFLLLASQVATKESVLPPAERQIVAATLFGRWRQGAKNRGLEFSLTLPYAQAVMDAQGSRCALTGAPLLVRGNTTSSNASLDRINSNIGYQPDNVQILQKDVNMMKRSMSDQGFIELCREITAYQQVSSMQAGYYYDDV